MRLCVMGWIWLPWWMNVDAWWINVDALCSVLSLNMYNPVSLVVYLSRICEPVMALPLMVEWWIADAIYTQVRSCTKYLLIEICNQNLKIVALFSNSRKLWLFWYVPKPYRNILVYTKTEPYFIFKPYLPTYQYHINQ